MEEKIDFNELFGNDNSIVIRIEKLLDGKSFEELQKGSDNLLKFYIEQFSEHVSKCKQELESMPLVEEDPEYQEYLEMLRLIESVSILSREELKKLADFCVKSTSSIENHMSRLSVIPNHYPNDEEYTEDDFEYNEEEVDDEMEDPAEDEYFIKSMKEYMILPKREQLRRDIEKYEKEIKQNQKYLKETYCFAINRDVLFENANSVFEILKNIKSKTSKKIEIVVDNDGIMTKSKGRVPYSYNEKELAILTKLLKENLIDNMYFSEFYTENNYPVARDQIFNFCDVYEANLQKNDFINKQKELKLSPFEFLMGAHLFVMPNDYEDEKSLNIEKCRTFLTANGSSSFDDWGFVCSAFASFGKALVDEYADENLSCDFLTIEFYDNEEKKLTSTHSALHVKINDEKYGIKGHYVWDLSNDSNYFSIAYCLFPVADLMHYKDEIAITVNDGDSSDYLKIMGSQSKKYLTPEDTNYVYEKYKNDSKPIAIKKYKFAVENYLNKLEKSGVENLAEFLEGHSKTKEQYIKNLFHDTLLNLGVFDPQESQNVFYKRMRDFYKNTTKENYKDWEENWSDCNAEYAEQEKFDW